MSDTVCVKALELRDGVKADYMGKGVSKAVENVNTVIGPALVGMAPSEQKAIDEKMVQVRQRSASKRTCLAPTNVCRSSMEARTTGAGRSRVGPLRIEMHVTACCLPTHDLASCAELGANAILGVSMAVCKAGAASKDMPLYKHIAELAGNPTDKMCMPVPAFNVINGGSHAGNKCAS